MPAATTRLFFEPPRLCVWTDITPEIARELVVAAKNPQRRLQVLCETFELQPATDETGRDAMTCDLLNSVVNFCFDQKFGPHQLSALVSIVKRTHGYCMLGYERTLDEGYAYFREIMMRHSVQRPPRSEAIFQLAELTAVNEFVLATYFRHYKLYNYAFGSRAKQPVESAPAADRPPTEVDGDALVMLDLEGAGAGGEIGPDGLPAVQSWASGGSPLIGGEDRPVSVTEGGVGGTSSTSIPPTPGLVDGADRPTSAPLEAAPVDAVQQPQETHLVDTSALLAQVPEPVRDLVLASLNNHIAEVKKTLEDEIEAQKAALLDRIATLESRLAADVASPAATGAKASSGRLSSMSSKGAKKKGGK